ncbi:hypothetical protein SDC9_201912 [bioreactor metagenome]|uniref:Uncharacterized protein n=1 Tax=bioreactor metagenome TaxID=1076179 RepID=A0A645ITR7_9ZZZZ
MGSIEANCPNCCKRTKFELKEKNNYKCMSCNSIMYKCKSKDCNNMIKNGFMCSKCIGDRLKNGGALIVTGALAIGGAGAKYLLKKGSSKS